ncbi:MAG: FAD-dependent oxidoreductase [Filomicrobium sp.]
MTKTDAARRKIAVVGTGISGLSAAWLLHNSCEIAVFEQSARVGGHSYTVDVVHGGGVTPADMGFIVFNEYTYPNLVALFEHLDVETQTTDMSFAVSLDEGWFEYGGGTLGQLIAQKRNLLRPRFWCMMRDIVRFYRTAPNDLAMLLETEMSLGDYLKANAYKRPFIENHLLPMAGAIWSMPASSVLDFPAHAFVRFYENHGLLKLANRPLWRTVKGGSRSYVQKLKSSFADRIETGDGVVSVERRAEGVFVSTRSGKQQRFDDVVIATHADEALGLLANPTASEQQLLSAFSYSENEAILHSDARFMPKRQRAWASWNYIGKRAMQSADGLTVTYWMNTLQNLPQDLPLFVTLNPNHEPDPQKVYRRQSFQHPVIDQAATYAQQRLWSLQGQDRVWFCGAYFGAGFHEDGLQSGLAVAEQLGHVRRPWAVENESGRIVVKPVHQPSREEGVAA